MSRTSFFFVVAGVSNLAFGDACIDIVDDDDRLACFDAARSCAAIQSEMDRLDCFDSAYLGTEAPESRAEIPDISAAVSLESNRPPGRSDPLELAEKTIKAEPKEDANISAQAGPGTTVDTSKGDFEATIVEVTTNPLRIDYFRLDNGQVWRETEDSRVRFEIGQKVKIERGIFGSVNMTMEGNSKTVKIKRVN